MASELPRAILVHATNSRARVRIDDHLGEEPFFAALADQLAQHGSVREVQANAVTGSLLILHDGDLQPIIEYARQRGLFEVVPSVSRSSMRTLQHVIDRVDAQIAAETDDALSLGKVAFVTLVGAGLWQAKNGHLLPAGMTLFNYALGVLSWAAGRESTNYPQNYPHRS